MAGPSQLTRSCTEGPPLLLSLSLSRSLSLSLYNLSVSLSIINLSLSLSICEGSLRLRLRRSYLMLRKACLLADSWSKTDDNGDVKTKKHTPDPLALLGRTWPMIAVISNTTIHLERLQNSSSGVLGQARESCNVWLGMGTGPLLLLNRRPAGDTRRCDARKPLLWVARGWRRQQSWRESKLLFVWLVSVSCCYSLVFVAWWESKFAALKAVRKSPAPLGTGSMGT